MPSLMSIARTIRRHALVKDIMAAPRRWALHANQSFNVGVFAVEIEATCGFFATMQLVLFILVHCEENDQKPVISARGGIYGEPTRTVDWFADLFEPTFTVADELRIVRTSRVRSVADLGFRRRYEAKLTLPRAHQLFTKYFRIAEELQARVQMLCQLLSVDQQTLGVHYRGTDKISEARRVSKAEVVQSVRSEISANPSLRSILLASDERDFIDYFTAQNFGLPVRQVPARHLSFGGKPVHFSNHPGLEIGREALIICALLSSCGVLIKTPSYLSAWAKILNPALRVRLLADSRYFPDHALWLAQAETLSTGPGSLDTHAQD